MTVDYGETRPATPNLERIEQEIADTSASADRVLSVHERLGMLSEVELERFYQVSVVLGLLDGSKSWGSFERTGAAVAEIIEMLITKLAQVTTDGPTEANNYRLLMGILESAKFRANISDLY